MAKGSKKAKAGRVKERQERRFAPKPTTDPKVAKAMGGAGSALLGAGAWAQFGHGLMGSELPPYSFAPALIAAGAVTFGIAVWLGTSGDAVLRVGSGGVGIEKGKEVTRVPWHGVERIVWVPDSQTLAFTGTDELGGEQRLTLTTKSQPAAIAWIVKEARERIPDLLDVPEEANGLPLAQESDGTLLVMDAVQVVGKRCAATNRIIAYEPDARVCPRCERVYYKLSVPDVCDCGASIQSLRATEEQPST